MEVHIQDAIARLAAIKEEHGNIPVVATTQTTYGWSYSDPKLVVGDLQGETKVVIFP
jgi:hypothetical protein